MPRILEPEVMGAEEEARAYDELDRLWGDVLFQGFAESAVRMGIREGRVLDVGCGPGRISVRLGKINPDFQIIGIDLSANMLALAEQNASKEGVSNRTSFRLGDAKQLPFPDETFDLVICHNFLHQLAEPLTALKEIKRVTKAKGGILIRDVWRLPAPLMSIVLPFYCLGYGRVLRRLTYDSYYAGLTYGDLMNLCREADLGDANIRCYGITHIGIERLANPYREPSPNILYPRMRGWRRLLKALYLIPKPR